MSLPPPPRAPVRMAACPAPSWSARPSSAESLLMLPSPSTFARRSLPVVAVAGAALLVATVPGPDRSATVQHVVAGTVTFDLPDTWVAVDNDLGMLLWADTAAESATMSATVYTQVPVTDAAAAAALYASDAASADPTWVQAGRQEGDLGGQDLIVVDFAAAGSAGTIWATSDDAGDVTVVEVRGQHVPQDVRDLVDTTLRAAG